jgi:2-phosphoglycerate kinase
MGPRRTWDVLLIGGASGTGKTSVSYRLARLYEVGIAEVDDLWMMVEALTTPEQQPILHRWRTDPTAFDWPAQRIVEHTIAVARTLAPGLRAVIDNHLEFGPPLVLEGDYVTPELIHAGEGDRVRAVFLHEPIVERIEANFLEREPEQGPQTKRAEVSWMYGAWLAQEARRRGIPVVEPRPWFTLVERVLDTLG